MTYRTSNWLVVSKGRHAVAIFSIGYTLITFAGGASWIIDTRPGVPAVHARDSRAAKERFSAAETNER